MVPRRTAFRLDDLTLSQSSRLDALSWKIRYLAPILDVPGAAEWVADLRVSMPVSKGLLIAETPQGGFTNPADAERFADWLAMKVRRPALHGTLSEGISEILDDVIKTVSKALDPSWYQDVEQIRLDIRPNRLAPTWVQIRVVSESPLSAEATAQWHTANKRVHALLKAANIESPVMRFDEIAKLSALQYRDSVHLLVSRLGKPAFW